MTSSWILSLRMAITRSTRLIVFGTARFIPKNQQANYQGSTIWSREKATLRKRILESLYRQSSPFESLLLPITKIIQKNP